VKVLMQAIFLDIEPEGWEANANMVTLADLQ
jgi:hypothetical protein